MVIEINHQNKLIALIIKDSYKANGVEFLTNNENPMQLAYMSHPTGKKIESHFHNYYPREVQYTQEVLLIKKGKLLVDFYDDQQKYIRSLLLSGGDTILLMSGGHGFEVIEEVEMIEIKQGPFSPALDKTRFTCECGKKIIEENKIEVVC